MIPVPISTPGFDNAPYTTCSHWFTKDIETGIRNAGNYRGQLKGRRKIGCYNQPGQHFTLHLEKCKEKGDPSGCGPGHRRTSHRFLCNGSEGALRSR